MTIKGSCLCNQVRFTLEGEFKNFYFCHCHYCQKGTGSAHASNLFASPAWVTWEAGEELITRFNLPDTRHTRSFCSRCGSPVPTVMKEGRLVLVPAGCLDAPVNIEPTAHLFNVSQANWEAAIAGAPRFDGYPE